ncbi:MAG: hypothetical protein ACKOWE_03435, partial [Micrococcales bacterium]
VVTLLRVLTFSTLNIFNLRDWLNTIYYFELFVMLLWAAWAAKRQMYLSLWLAVAFSIFSAISTRIWGLGTAPRADALWILSLTKLFNSTGNLDKLDRITAIRRGFAYPLMLSMGPQTEYLSAFTPFAYLVLIVTLIWAVRALTKPEQRKRALLISVSLLVVLATAVMPLRIMYYLGAHSLVAIAYVLSAVAVAIAVRDGVLSRTNRIVLLLGFALAAVSTAEALAILAVISLPLLSSKWLARKDAYLITLAATVPFAIWLATYNSFLIQITGLVWFIACPLFVLIGLSIATPALDGIRLKARYWVPALMIGYLLLMWVLFPENMQAGNQALIQNLFLGQGDWGSVPYFVAFAIGFVIFSSVRSRSSEIITLVYLVIQTSIASMVAKLLAGAQLGDPLLGRFAWTDSLNRMWFQILALAMVTIVVGISQQDWLWNGRISGKLDKANLSAKAKN